MPSIEKYRDIFKLWKGRPFVILGIENQTKEEYVLPERILLYDILGYEAQSGGLPENTDKKEI